ncbi:phage holin family protein [Brachybacterium alimentarium]|uniref:phage holin family protein n=1 Tax=Brachybacterium alimentarium TaxID=47845 RepID=UPI000DF34A0B|nr:phage holin family protein [Brachybacterium alimentarium]RCS83736.1 phage holin family protein [Brachybacterium alimentarium]
MSSPHPPEEASVAHLVDRLSEQTSRLVRDELKLARAEYTEKAKQGGTAAGLFGAGAVLAWFGLGALIATVILLLALVLPPWAAALIVTVVVFLAAGVAALLGKKKAEGLTPTPERTVATLRRDADEITERI